MRNLLNLFQSEWRKTVGNTRVITFLVWIYPLITLLIVLLINSLGILPSAAGRARVLQSPPLWTQELRVVFTLFTTFPNNIIVSVPFLVFVAMLFAGEYQWGTWKNITTRQPRAILILTKYLTLSVLIVIALASISFIWGLGGGLTALIVGLSYAPQITTEVLAEFARGYLIEISTTFLAILIASSYVASLAIVSRSPLASALLGITVSLAEHLFPMGLLMGGQLFDKPHLLNYYIVTPTYNLENIASWLTDGVAYAYAGMKLGEMPEEIFSFAFSLPQSVLITGLWVAGLVALTVLLFQRQDITA